MRPLSTTASFDLRLSAFVARRHGLVTRDELLRAGLSPDAIKRRLRAGRLHKVFRNVYSPVPLSMLPDESWWMAGVLTTGKDAVLSHEPAGALWDLREWRSRTVHVTKPGGSSSKQARLVVHRSRAIESTTRRGIRVTTVARTLLDLAADLGSDVRWPLNEAQYKRVYRPEAIEQILAAHPNHPGAAPLREAAQLRPTLTRSELERAFRAISERAGLPEPEGNFVLHGYEVDFFYPSLALVVEVDGFAAHTTKLTFEKDREMQVVMRAHGIAVIRFSHDQVVYRPEFVETALRGEAPRS